MTDENETEDVLCRQCDCTGTGKDHHDNGGYAVACTACSKDALRTDWETIDGGSVNFHWREVCVHCGHVSESLFA